jgi:ribosomal RNA-processing protein 36
LYLLRKAQNKLKEKDAAGSDYDSDASVETTTTISGLPEHERTKRLNDIKRRLAAMQRTKGKALNVRVSSDEESEEGQQDGRDNGWAIRRERREEREKEKDAETRREERREKLKRGDKNAPMAMSVKRAVTRKRTVIEPEKVVSRVSLQSASSNCSDTLIVI